MAKVLIYDCEIKRCIPPKNGEKNPRYEYCGGWGDFPNMGIACVGIWTNWIGYEVFLESELSRFQELIDRADEIIGFNSLSFDDRLMAANGIQIQTTYDLLCEARLASGQPAQYSPEKTRPGYGLNALAKATLGKGKTGTGENAPILWQEGKRGEVIQYCLADVALTRELWERKSAIVDPTNGKILFLRGGSRWEWIKTRISAFFK